MRRAVKGRARTGRSEVAPAEGKASLIGFTHMSASGAQSAIVFRDLACCLRRHFTSDEAPV